MPDYKEMYLTLFRETSRAILTLQAAQKRTEERYIADVTAEPMIVLCEPGEEGREQPTQE